MATNLAGGVCIGQLNACVVRVAKLDADCTPTGGADSGYVTAALATLSAEPDIEEGTRFEPKNACGELMFTYEQDSRIKRYNLSGEFFFFDWEMLKLLFGGDLVLGAAGGPFAGKVIGHAMPNYTVNPTSGVYLEVITQAVVEGAGDCQQPAAAAAYPSYIGHIFGKVRLTPGSRTFENDVARVTFTGVATNNPLLTNGPWNDYPGAGYIPNSPYTQVGYSAAQYNTILGTVGCGYQTLPAGS